ncbi:MAG: ABC transporter ATP-binding protein [Pyrinomonadaceae bacterium]|nr:ABC transporter ATP-binding protein [Phycisphaerales bacterium]
MSSEHAGIVRKRSDLRAPRASAAGGPSIAAGIDQHIDSDVALSVRGLSKCYHIYSKPRDRLKQAVTRKIKTYYKPFWALDNVNFEVKKGEAVGVVGRNGSGKSTLLQIIAGTLTPTTGQVVLRGRIAALLELGSGFNPEFTGRDNVFLNAAILGITRKEMESRFDDIAAFADIGQFLDQPVKHYSSGMHARLAFSVAISVDPDILILDEILSVGDMGFQQKCVARMKKLLDSGVTLLFVSHAPDAVKSLCQKGLFLADGKVQHWGTAEDAVNKYFGYIREATYEEAKKTQPQLAQTVPLKTEVKNSLRYGTGHAQVQLVRLLDDTGKPVQAYNFGERITLEVTIQSLIDLTNLDVAFVIRDSAGVDLFGTGVADEYGRIPTIPASGRVVVKFSFVNNLRGGNYGVTLTLTRLGDQAGEFGITLDNLDACATFRVISIPTRPVHHKVHHAVNVETTVLGPSDNSPASNTVSLPSA